ncbi:hypothetical protein [Burkholderia ubonensis]|uniref:hypothetical protein n=1 Tax=Burkholderia ubonensis TaxID=101571 RepID=UPI000A6B2106|nr:hypothetical protein [Burkholderia ubonensis]
MTQSRMTLWQAIDALAQQVPFSKAKVEHALSTRLTETDEGGMTCSSSSRARLSR